jgi:hypothetical protein
MGKGVHREEHPNLKGDAYRGCGVPQLYAHLRPDLVHELRRNR